MSNPTTKPIPAFYAVYVLRSSVRHASLYVGSTPNPPRRLQQHNGEKKGGANRTSRDSLRPWEMITLVSGFPSQVAALKFEWALDHAHLTTHIPAESRIAPSTQRKRNGVPRRRPHSLASIMQNIHLLTTVPSFARWPLNLHFFTQETHTAWETMLRRVGSPARPALKVFVDLKPAEEETPWGIHALTLDYSSMGDYVEKAHDVVAFERQGKCVCCQQELAPGGGLYPMCPHEDCEAMGHLDCWARHALASDHDSESKALIPNECKCPSCGGNIRWGVMMKELSIRVRGKNEVEKLLKKRRQEKKNAMKE